ncbi:hypothetical protein CAOG_03809 [Capsaspora owczarzaki ATCC 30864]|uniref:VHS domain-containing protein n=1 Tax=Capsaspora owczarzaki (strain ATCC 30864) TaxID=595528 RepID=A0A0D2VQI2_CAPO3|nr:hypothetical protein CAOG_03809 [Capsaspora owczarzaki ATCC 30864]KJE92927.1 hypothetical protein CAOG_003809 [Capsaspora owczarzaki ATCC 30864]|eukprot:XP_004363537.1 hypothetical protein CAOG_03809 [Capsaspora owczarzaki ATCC 30864]
MFGTSKLAAAIERCTNETQPSEDWNLILEICDQIKHTDTGPKEAIKTIQKRLSNKNASVIYFTLVLLEACVKNAGERFHAEIANQEFLNFLVKLVQPKSPIPARSREKILELLQSWSDNLGHQHEYALIKETVRKLRDEGIEFPAQDMDAMSPIHTPQAHAMPSPSRPTAAAATLSTYPTSSPPSDRGGFATMSDSSPGANAYSRAQQPPSQPQPQPHPQPTFKLKLEPHQRAKLTTEFGVVTENCNLFREVVSAQQPNEPIESFTLELKETLEAMQSRIMALVEQVLDEDIIVTLLSLNDKLNTALGQFAALTPGHQRTQQGFNGPPQSAYPAARSGFASSQQQQQQQPGHATPTTYAPSPAASSAPAEPQLIDFDSMPLATSASAPQPPATRTASSDAPRPGSAFLANPFASTGSTYDDNMEAPSMGSLAGAMSARANLVAGQAPPAEDDAFSQLASSRLSARASTPSSSPPQQSTPLPTAPGQSSISTADFDDFLAERGFSSKKSSTTTLLTAPPANTQNRRQLNLEEQDEDMFGL